LKNPPNAEAAAQPIHRELARHPVAKLLPIAPADRQSEAGSRHSSYFLLKRSTTVVRGRRAAVDGLT
jgi:hypothetical protein